ncbi:MAG: AEC family transporter [Spirochaetales bacterium]|nr:AEC family transporter [Spirochaetales bacterium]MCF7938484.1 AEC family transporter [Spirochaetales bacterium]
METFISILFPLLQLLGLTILGFYLFRISFLQKHILKPLITITLSVLFPLYFIHNFSSGWNEALASGPKFMFMLLGACIGMMIFQLFLGKIVTPRRGEEDQRIRPEAVALYTAHNAGYVPLPILDALLPDSVMVVLFFYVLGFNLMFWTVVYSQVRPSDTEAGEHKGKTSWLKQIKRMINPPLIGILTGLLLASTGWYQMFPRFVTIPFEGAAFISLKMVMVVLGGTLAAVPRQSLGMRVEYRRLLVLKMLIYPAAMLLLMWFIPMEGMKPILAFGIRVALVLEAAMPPATNLLILVRAFNKSSEHVNFTAGGIIYTYLTAVITIPLFLVLSILLFG